jgi:hypothetical protein
VGRTGGVATVLVDDQRDGLQYAIFAEISRHVPDVIQAARTHGRWKLIIMPGIWVVTAAVYYLFPGDGGFNDFLYLAASGFSLGAGLEIVTLLTWQRRPLLRVRRFSSQAAINWDNRPAANWRREGIAFLIVLYGAMYLVWPPLASCLICLYLGAVFVAVVVVWTLRLRPRPSVLALIKALQGFSLRPNGPQYAVFRAAIEQGVRRRSSDGHGPA